MRPSEDFCGLLLQFRGRTELSQRDLAQRLHVHVRSVQLWEAGASHPNARHLQALIGLLLQAQRFGAGRERAEASALWTAVELESDRLKAPFDERWFEALLVERSPPPPTAEPLPRSTGAQHWGDAPDVARFLGRTTERDTLRQWLRDGQTRVVTVVGMGGIGKTMLSARVATDLAPFFERVCWRSVRDAPPFDDWLAETLRMLTPDRAPPGGTSRLEHLLELAREVRFLLARQLRVTARAGKPPGRVPGWL